MIKQFIRNKTAPLLLTTLMATSATTAQAESWQLAWKISDLPNPESVIYNPPRDVLFVSNQALGAQPGEASISMLSTNGAVIDKNWITGLNEPKGMHIVGDKLYVSDVTELVEIDISEGKISQRYPAENARFLNDVTADSNGNVYVSDMFTSAIYRLDTNNQLQLWLQSPKLENPNGLLVQGDKLLVAGWGKFNDGKPLEAPHGNLLSVSLQNKAIARVSTETLGNLDGLIPHGDGEYYLSDWVDGAVLNYSAKTGLRKIIDTDRSSGDIAYLEDQGLLLVPMALQNEVRVYSRRHITTDLGVRRDGSYYTRLEWASHTLDTPLYWAANINDDDTARNSGSWGAPTTGPADAVLSFFGETQAVKRIRIFHNVGATVSPLDELAKTVKISLSNDADLQRIGDKTASLEDYTWQQVVNATMEQREGWFEFELPKPVNARYVRLQLTENFGTPPERSFVETSEIKLYGK